MPALRDASTVVAGGGRTCGLYGGEVRCLAGAKGLVADPAFAGARVSLLALGAYQACGVIEGARVRCVEHGKSDEIVLADVVELGVGASERCARTRDGTVTCWQAAAEPAEQVRGAVSLAVGWVHGCAALGDGTVRCWGINSDGELGSHGNHSKTAIAVPGITDAVQVAAGVRGTCVLHATGEVSCFGRMADPSRPSARVVGVRDATALVLGAAHACTLGRGGAVTCWGANDDGQLGRIPAEARHLAEPVPGLARITKVVGFAYTDGCAIDEARDVWCWGSSPVAPETKLARPTKIPELSGARDLALGYDTACLLRTDRSLQCWGRTLPAPAAKLRGVDEVTVGYTHACARTGGVVSCWGELQDRVPPITDATGLQADSNATCVARTRGGWQCWDVPDNRDFSDAVAVSAPDGGSACKLLATGRVKCTGYGWWGALGNGVVGKRHADDWGDAVGLDDVTELAGTHNSQCAIRKDGTLWCWGDVTPMFGLAASRENRCNLGDGPPSPCVMAPTKVPEIAQAVHVMLVGRHAGCVVIRDGTVRCWGAAGRSAWGRVGSAEDAAPVTLPP